MHPLSNLRKPPIWKVPSDYILTVFAVAKSSAKIALSLRFGKIKVGDRSVNANE
jgi:hypothetical protein